MDPVHNSSQPKLNISQCTVYYVEIMTKGVKSMLMEKYITQVVDKSKALSAKKGIYTNRNITIYVNISV